LAGVTGREGEEPLSGGRHHLHHADRADRPHSDGVVHGQVREDLFPEVREVIIDDRDLDQSGVDHLEQIFVL